VRPRATSIRRCCEWTVFGLVPAVVAVSYSASFLRRGVGEPDFGAFWLASRAALHGHSPYTPLASLPHAASIGFDPFVYPPIVAFLLAPLAALPFVAARLLFLAVNLGAVVLALRLLGVRDWRCYGIALVTPAVVESVASGTISILLLLGVAAAWRYRDRAVAVALLVASAVTAKLFLWPLWFWLVRTGRRRAAAAAVVASFAALAGSWALIGFAGLRDYPRLLARLTELVGPHSYSTYALERVLGVGAAAQATYAVGVIALVLALRFVADERRSFVALLGVALLATPILWPHYLVLLFVPVALASPTLTRVWFVPLLLWVNPAAWNSGSVAPIVAELVVTLAALATVVQTPTEPPSAVVPRLTWSAASAAWRRT